MSAGDDRCCRRDGFPGHRACPGLGVLEPDGDRILPSEATALDDDWLAVFAAGMPESGGLCIGLERLLLTVTGASDLRDVIPFPLQPGA